MPCSAAGFQISGQLGTQPAQIWRSLGRLSAATAAKRAYQETDRSTLATVCCVGLQYSKHGASIGGVRRLHQNAPRNSHQGAPCQRIKSRSRSKTDPTTSHQVALLRKNIISQQAMTSFHKALLGTACVRRVLLPPYARSLRMLHHPAWACSPMLQTKPPCSSWAASLSSQPRNPE